MMSERDVRMALAELEELYAHWVEELGPQEARRRFRQQARQYPLRLLAGAVASVVRAGPWASPRDVLLSVRSLARAPGLTAAIVLTVGVGIGGCTVLFAVVDTLFLRPPPYPEAERLVWIHTYSPPNRWPFSVADYQALQAQQTSFDEVAAYVRNTRVLSTAEGAERIQVVEVAPGLLELLGATPSAGRLPTTEEGAPAAEATVVVTRGFAERQFGAIRPDGSDALGRTLLLDGTTYTVIGVLPAWRGPLGTGSEVFPVLRLQPPERKGPFFLAVFGRLRQDVDPGAAAEELAAINKRLFPLWEDSYQDDRATWGMQDLQTVLQGGSGRLIATLMGAVGLLLLVAVANATNLLLTRVNARSREIAVRKALGATRAQVAGHLLTESSLLAVGGVAVGLLLAQGGLAVLPVVAGQYIPRAGDAALSGSVLTFALALAATCGLLFGLVPAVRGIGGAGIGDGLRSARTAGQSRGEQRLQRILVAGQLTLVVPLLVGAGLLVTSFVNRANVDPGFEAENVVSMRVSPGASSSRPEERRQFWDDLVDRVSAMPGVSAVGVANGRPPDTHSGTNNFDLEDRPTPPGQSQPGVPWILAESGYFETLGIPLLAGRLFEELDDDPASQVVLVDAAWAERFFPGEDAVGRRFREGGCTTCDWTTVVGVVGEVPYGGLGNEGSGVIYAPDPRRYSSEPYLFVRTAADPAGIVGRIRSEVHDIDASTPVTQVATGESLLRDSLTRPRHLSLLLAVFALVALAMAVIGLYGVTAYAVEQRRGDIAVRLALGGSPGAVLGMIVRQAMALSLTGLLVGTVAALGLTRVLGALLYEISPRDPALFVSVAGVMLAVSAVACLVPGRRAVRLDPASTLREE